MRGAVGAIRGKSPAGWVETVIGFLVHELRALELNFFVVLEPFLTLGGTDAPTDANACDLDWPPVQRLQHPDLHLVNISSLLVLL